MLKFFLEYAKKRGINKVFVYFRDEDGEIKNICFQNDIFFRLEKNEQIRFLNPLVAMDTLVKIHNRELQLVGTGRYMPNVDFSNYYYERKGQEA